MFFSVDTELEQHFSINTGQNENKVTGGGHLKRYIKSIRNHIMNEDGNSSVEMAILFPIIILVVMYITDRFIIYEGLTATSITVNEAVRYAIVQDDKSDAESIVKETLEDRFANQKMGWCLGDDISRCQAWKAGTVTRDQSAFESTQSANLFIDVSDDEWCYGHYVTVGVRAHKASLIPSYENFRRLLTEGGPIFHTHKYTIKARIESSKECSDVPQI